MVPVGAPSPALCALRRPSPRLLTGGASQTIHKICSKSSNVKKPAHSGQPAHLKSDHALKKIKNFIQNRWTWMGEEERNRQRMWERIIERKNSPQMNTETWLPWSPWEPLPRRSAPLNLDRPLPQASFGNLKAGIPPAGGFRVKRENHPRAEPQSRREKPKP